MNFSGLLSGIAGADTRVAKVVVERQHPIVAATLPRLSNAANHSKLWFVTAAASAAFGGRRGRRAALRGLMSVGISSAIANGMLKPVFPRTRPPVDPSLLSIVRRPRSSSFPSGHSASAAAYAVATAMEAPALAAPVAALAAGVAYSRVTTGVHHPSDVIVGAAIGAAVAAATTKIWPRVDPSPARVAPSPTRFAIEPSPTGGGLVVVVNSASGSSAHRSELDTIESALPDATIHHVEDPSELQAAFDDAAHAEGTVAIGALGGDGTIGACAAAAHEAGIPLVVFPGGTLNHFARDLGVSTIDDAVDAVRNGQLVEIDVATIDERMFLNTASFGSYSEFVEAREKHEDKLGKWPAVVLALANVLRHGEPIEAELNGSTRKIWMIFIGNCAYDPPGFAPASRDRLDDGLFDVRTIDGTDPHARLRLIGAIITGRLGRSKVYTRELVTELNISTASSTTRLAADGETFEGSGTFSVAKPSRRLRTFAPHCD